MAVRWLADGCELGWLDGWLTAERTVATTAGLAEDGCEEGWLDGWLDGCELG